MDQNRSVGASYKPMPTVRIHGQLAQQASRAEPAHLVHPSCVELGNVRGGGGVHYDFVVRVAGLEVLRENTKAGITPLESWCQQKL